MPRLEEEDQGWQESDRGALMVDDNGAQSTAQNVRVLTNGVLKTEEKERKEEKEEPVVSEKSVEEKQQQQQQQQPSEKDEAMEDQAEKETKFVWDYATKLRHLVFDEDVVNIGRAVSSQLESRAQTDQRLQFEKSDEDSFAGGNHTTGKIIAFNQA